MTHALLYSKLSSGHAEDGGHRSTLTPSNTVLTHVEKNSWRPAATAKKENVVRKKGAGWGPEEYYHGCLQGLQPHCTPPVGNLDWMDSGNKKARVVSKEYWLPNT